MTTDIRRARLCVLPAPIRVVAAFALVAMALALSGCGYDHYQWHQKTTVTVETPDGLKAGSAVVEVRAAFTDDPIMGANEVNYEVRGEAVVVELAPGKVLFALLGGSEERFYRAVRDRLKGKSRGEWLGIIPTMTDVAVLESKNVPLLVTFDDLADPASVKRVDPTDLRATFGPGFALKSITLEVTEEPVTEGDVEAVLGWLGEYPEPGLCSPTGISTNIPFCRRVHHGDFVRR